MMLCTTSREVIDAIRSVGAMRIGIDGINGAGKSTLGAELSSALGLKLVNLDAFVERNRGGFVEYLDYQGLKIALDAAEGFVVEGICLLQVLGRIGVQAEANIYIKRMQHGIWADEAELDIREPVEEVLVRLREEASPFASGPDDSLSLAEEVIRYHAQFRPHQRAEVTYVVSAR